MCRLRRAQEVADEFDEGVGAVQVGEVARTFDDFQAAVRDGFVALDAVLGGNDAVLAAVNEQDGDVSSQVEAIQRGDALAGAAPL